MQRLCWFLEGESALGFGRVVVLKIAFLDFDALAVFEINVVGPK